MLSDYRVLDLTDARGALCGQLLADLGADVLRVEASGGSPMRSDSSWSILARNCSSCVLDVERPENRARLERLVSDADLVIAHDIALGELNYSELRERQPGLVWLAITPFGVDGPKSSYQATDLIVQAAGGAMAINGFDDAKPLRTGAITAWSHAGAAAAGAALLALRQRDKTGRGQLVDISAQLSVNLTASFSLLTPFAGATRMRRAKQNPVGAIPLIWPASDGFVSITLAFAGPMIGFARNLFAWMREANALDERLAQLDWPTYLEQLRRGNAEQNDLDDLLEALGQFLAARKKDELLEGAIAHGALLVPVSSTHDLLDSPQLAARNFWWVDDGARQPGPFAHFSAAPLRLRSPAPAYNPDAAGRFLPRPDDRLPAVSATNGDPALPLAGVKILDFSWVMAGPWCTRLLADYGATVVKVESRTRMDLVRVLGPFYNDQFSPETSASFASINAGKLSIDLDPNQPEGKAKLLELVDWADIVMESFSPRAMKKWGLDYACLQERKPGIIMLSSCLFGQTGPYASMAGYGTMGAALGGLVLPTGLPGRPPCGPFGPYTDYIAPRFSVIALLAALHHRDRTGIGQHIDQSQSESSTLVMSAAITASSLGAPAPDRLGNEHAVMYPHDVYPCSGDDQWVAIAVRDQEDWQALCGILGRKDWADLTLALRRQSRDEIDQAITAWTQPRSATEVEVTLQRQNVPAHSVMNATLSRNDPQFTHRKHFQETAHSTLGKVYVESVGYEMELAQPCVGKIPSLGGDKDDVLAMVAGAENEVKPQV